MGLAGGIGALVCLHLPQPLWEPEPPCVRPGLVICLDAADTTELSLPDESSPLQVRDNISQSESLQGGSGLKSG